MSASRNGFLARDITQHGKVELAQRCVSVAKVLPQGNTINIFTVSAPIIVTGLFGVISTLWGASTKLGLGVTGAPAAIAAQPAAAQVGAAGSVVCVPATFGGPMVAPIAASGQLASACMFTMDAAAITATADTSTTGAITWVLEYTSMLIKCPAVVAAA